MNIIKLNLPSLLNQRITIELTSDTNQKNQWHPLLQHRGNQYDFIGSPHALQIIGPVSNEFQQLMSREQLKHSRLAILTIKDLISLHHRNSKTNYVTLDNHREYFTFNLSQPISHTVSNTLGLFKHESITNLNPKVIMDKTSIDELFNYLLVTHSENEAILSLDENWQQIQDTYLRHEDSSAKEFTNKKAPVPQSTPPKKPKVMSRVDYQHNKE